MGGNIAGYVFSSAAVSEKSVRETDTGFLKGQMTQHQKEGSLGDVALQCTRTLCHALVLFRVIIQTALC